MDIQLADLTLHIDETLDRAGRDELEEVLRAIDGVVSVHNPDATPHLAIVQYNPDRTDSAELLRAVTSRGIHAELIGM